ncbi:NADPH-dependent F420 reductase [Methylobacterium nonmethylotrophicum]|uniref:NADP oxidoreductase n=1 Tax=Methylobacterium nonmethylotrophicum TaxID=1141884 RepID=A0A4Z0NXJ1_9HYPH|nr:NAD(P)-binding domain-containing protein [Methylobacterium nonmethylotrophicum]TGE02569.1 NADP oxidoreductase [Methylobacterium nonmethylotrophicum]
MRIGIIGAGYVGRAVAQHAVAHGHAVMVANSRGPRSLFSLGVALGCRIGTAAEAAAFGEVVVAAIPLHAYETLPGAELAGKVVLDAMNYYPERDGPIAALDARRATTSGLVAGHLPASRIVKAFNAITAQDLEADGRPAGAPDRRALPLAGDDAAAKAAAAELVDQFGFDPVDAGSLAESWRFERAKPAYCVPLDRDGLRRALAAAERDREVAPGSWRKDLRRTAPAGAAS